uniref:Uncharacterized protein n=1 Tax=Cyprinus carpio carpio TaxID=630221 RepID=A0A9J8DEQ2_CYPCA
HPQRRPRQRESVTERLISLEATRSARILFCFLWGDDTFELHSVQLELEAVEKQIQVLEQRQSQLREWRAALETSRADAHKSRVSIQRAANSPNTSTPCVSLHRPGAPRTRSAQMSFTPAPGHHGPWVHPQRRTRARPRATTSPPPVFEISTRNRLSPLREMERDAVIVGDSIVRHVRATLVLRGDDHLVIAAHVSTRTRKVQ